MNALDVYTKINIKDYLANPEESKDKNYSKKKYLKLKIIYCRIKKNFVMILNIEN